MHYETLISAELYRVYEPGEVVTKGGKSHVVREYFPPRYPGGEAALFLDDDPHGVTTENFMAANEPFQPSLEDPRELLEKIHKFLNEIDDLENPDKYRYAQVLARRIDDLLNP